MWPFDRLPTLTELHNTSGASPFYAGRLFGLLYTKRLRDWKSEEKGCDAHIRRRCQVTLRLGKRRIIRKTKQKAQSCKQFSSQATSPLYFDLNSVVCGALLYDFVLETLARVCALNYLLSMAPVLKKVFYTQKNNRSSNYAQCRQTSKVPKGKRKIERPHNVVFFFQLVMWAYCAFSLGRRKSIRTVAIWVIWKYPLVLAQWEVPHRKPHEPQCP